MRSTLRLKILALLMLAMLPALSPMAAYAQQLTPAPPQNESAPPPSYTPEQLDQMTAPIALYPDQLVGQVLMASTYPLEVVEATRWQQQNAQLNGDALQAALDQQPWDPSVKSLVAFPQVLSMMNGNLQWTEQLGNAFLANQSSVMDSVQRLRAQAQAAGNLQSSAQQTVTGQPGDLMIQPANPQVVYVPTYNPQVVYGTWAYPEYPPYYFAAPPGYIYTDVGPIAFFATGIVIADWFWGWDHWDWYHHRIDIDRDRFEALNRGRAPAFSGDMWAHNPSHRHGVPYTNPAVRTQFQPAEDAARRNFRGFAPRAVQPPSPPQPVVRPQPASSANFSRGSVTGNRASFNRPAQATHTQPAVRSSTSFTARPAMQPQVQRSSPVFESFQRGSDVRAASQRGAYSRSTMPAAAPERMLRAAPAARPAPAARAAPSGGGSRGNDGRDHNH